MTPIAIPGGSYVDATETTFAALVQVIQAGKIVDGYVSTHLGRVNLPPGETWGLQPIRVPDDGSPRIAGVSHSVPNRVYEWTGEKWRAIAGLTGGVIYNAHGELVTAPIVLTAPDGSQSYSSAGYGYVADDGSIVIGQDCYEEVVAEGLTLYSVTRTGGLVFGCLLNGGFAVFDPNFNPSQQLGALRSIVPAGTCFYPRVRSDASTRSRFVIAMWLVEAKRADIYPMSREQLLAQPLLGTFRTLGAPPPPDRDPIPPPAPPPHNPNSPAPSPPSPPPRPALPVQPAPPFPVAHPSGVQQMKVFLRLNGYYVGVQPGTTQVYTDRAAGGAWEEVRLDAKGGGLFVATFVAADAVLSIQPNGRLETRPPGTDGPYELARATSQPEGLDILYRVDGVNVLGVPLTIEEIK